MVTDQQDRRLFKLMQKALNLPSYRLEAPKRQISTVQQDSSVLTAKILHR